MVANCKGYGVRAVGIGGCVEELPLCTAVTGRDDGNSVQVVEAELVCSSLTVLTDQISHLEAGERECTPLDSVHSWGLNVGAESTVLEVCREVWSDVLVCFV